MNCLSPVLVLDTLLSREKKVLLTAILVSVVMNVAWATGQRAIHSGPALVRFRVLYKFKGGDDGATPYDRLIHDSHNTLYGTTASGGANDTGTVFKLSRSSKSGDWTEQVLYSFGSSSSGDGYAPFSKLILDRSGNLFGTTFYGGSFHGGTVFRLDSNGVETVLYSFTGGSDGGSPYGGLTWDKNGNLYGVTAFGANFNSQCYHGCGTVFELSPDGKGGWTFLTLHSFDGSDGCYSYTDLNIDSSGILWGTTTECGTDGYGVVFNLVPSGNGWTYHVIHNFNGVDGWSPTTGRLVFGERGQVFGATWFGGNYSGNAFSLAPTGNGAYKMVNLHNFGQGKDGSYPNCDLRFRKSGLLYGASSGGGANGDGTVFELLHRAGGWQESVLHSFSGSDGSGPRSGPITGNDENHLFGVTTAGGAGSCRGGCGVVYEITR
jgi:uncharacterized repeat protein (TIGR03803 family)